MGLIIDIVAICFLIVSALVAYYKGFVKTFFGFVSVVLSISPERYSSEGVASSNSGYELLFHGSSMRTLFC